MKRPDHIFCDPDFRAPLEAVFPRGTVHGFSWNVTSVQEDIRKLNVRKDQSIWLLFSPAETYDQNSAVKDHMNLCRENPLIGPLRDDGPRFPDMSSVYLDDDGVIAVLGEDPSLVDFEEPWVSICGGIWEAIVLSRIGLRCKAWVVVDLEKWVKELPAFD